MAKPFVEVTKDMLWTLEEAGKLKQIDDSQGFNQPVGLQVVEQSFFARHVARLVQQGAIKLQVLIEVSNVPYSLPT